MRDLVSVENDMPKLLIFVIQASRLNTRESGHWRL